MTRVRGETGSSEPFARRKGLEGGATGTRSGGPVACVVCAVLGWMYRLPVNEETLRYVSLGAGIGAFAGMVLSGAGSYLDRLLALDATAVGTFVVVTISLVVWLWYLASVARSGGQEGIGSKTWVVWLFGVGYVTLMMMMFLVAAAPLLY